MGDEDEYAAGFPSIRNIGDGGCDARWARAPGTNGDFGARAGQQRNARRRIDSGLFPRMASSLLSLVRAAGIRSRPGDEQVAWTPAARWRYRLAGITSHQGYGIYIFFSKLY